MAQLSNKDVLKLAKLSRLRISDEEVDLYAKEITEILAYVEQLQALDLADYDPTTQVTGLTNVTRPDTPVDYQATQIALLKNVPAISDGYIKVKRMIQ
jgi:aspartyl-tRNA(Asn)/glutamyl-tRNA(Gln) amidotransferase subunit C